MEKVVPETEIPPEAVVLQAAQITLEGKGPEDPRAMSKVHRLGSTELVDAGVGLQTKNLEDVPEDTRRIVEVGRKIVNLVTTDAEKAKIAQQDNYKRVKIAY